MLTFNRKLDYENLGSVELYVNPDESVTIRLTRVNDRIYAIPYDIFPWFDGGYYIRHETNVDRNFIKSALMYAGYDVKTTKHSAGFQAGLLIKTLKRVKQPGAAVVRN